MIRSEQVTFQDLFFSFESQQFVHCGANISKDPLLKIRAQFFTFQGEKKGRGLEGSLYQRKIKDTVKNAEYPIF